MVGREYRTGHRRTSAFRRSSRSVFPMNKMNTQNTQLKTTTQQRGFTPTPTLALLPSLIRKCVADAGVYLYMRIHQQFIRQYARKPKLVSGFTLIETLVAVTVLVAAIAGPLTIASRGLASANLARDQLIANFLAQEAIEFVRNTRDENVLRGSDWLAGLGSCSAQGCEIDVPHPAIKGSGEESD